MANELAALSDELAAVVERTGRMWRRWMRARDSIRAGSSGAPA